jgi:alanine racemase
MSKKLSTLTVDLKKIRENYLLLCQNSNNRIVASVIKSNAYGLGVTQVSGALFKAGCRHFFIADWPEVLLLPETVQREAQIYSLVGPEPEDFAQVISNNVIPIFHRVDQVHSWIAQTTNPFGVQLNTTLNRLGLTEEEFQSLRCAPTINLAQLSCGYLEYPENSKDLEMMERIGGTRTDASSCSFLLKQSKGMIRSGRWIYGLKTNVHPVCDKLQTVATLTSPILQIRPVEPGDHVGYKRDYLVTKPMHIAVVNIGYGSGYLVLPSLKQSVCLNGHRCEIISQTMDFTTIDVTGLDCQVGDSVELIGPEIPQENSNYRIRIIGHVRRVFLNE